MSYTPENEKKLITYTIAPYQDGKCKIMFYNYRKEHIFTYVHQKGDPISTIEIYPYINIRGSINIIREAVREIKSRDKNREREIYEILEDRRKNMKLSLRELGLKTGIPYQNIAEYEKGKRDFSSQKVYAIMKVLRLKIEKID